VIAGTAYGVILNDRQQLERMGSALSADPYKGPPKAPVLYVKPRTCFRFAGAAVPVPKTIAEVEIAPTIGLLMARDVTAGRRETVLGAIGAACLALDVSEPHTNFFRPAVRQRSRDGFLPLGAFSELPATLGEIVTEVDGKEVHRWSPARLVRSIEGLLEDISAFMTLSAGDLLLVGLPGDAPKISAGKTAAVSAKAFATLHAPFIPESAS
jgi:5-oxopent-3-ene-1,2,5-tricarboxylate decarboxylase/2-hydroxyhepta-2,4-diene-1,7-dioate isomerase